MNYLDKFFVPLALFSVFFFSYLPTKTIINALPLPQEIIFILLVFSILAFLSLKAVATKMLSIDKLILRAVYFYLIFACYAAGSFFLTGDLLGDLFNIRTVVAVNPIFILLALYVRNKKSFLLKSLYILSGIYFIYFFIALYGGQISFDSKTSPTLFADFENVYQNINVYLGLFSLINLIAYSFQKNIYKKALFLVLSSISFVEMFFIGGRASVVALFFSAVTLFFINGGIFKLKKIFIVSFFSLFLIAIAFVFSDILLSSITIRRILTLTDVESDSSSRLFLFTSAIDLFTSSWKTIFLGGGMNSFPVYTGWHTTGAYPHNIFLELLAEYGLIGFSLFMYPLVIIYEMRKGCYGTFWGTSPDTMAVLVISIYYITINLFTGGMRSSWVLIFFIYLLIPSQADLLQKEIPEDNSYLNESLPHNLRPPRI